jgi:hypothetical protein
MKITKASWGKVIFPAIFLMAVTVLLVLPFWHSSAANPTLTNADFETGPFTTQNVVTGWTVTGNAADLAQGATSGTHSAGLSAGADSQGDSISQSFTTTNGQGYTVAFDAGIFGRRTGGPLSVRVEVIGASNATLVNQVVQPPDAGTWTASQVQFTRYSFPFVANGSSATVRFTSIGAGNGSADEMIDTVAITETANPNQTTICDATAANADACYTLRPPPCTSGQAFWFPNADCAIPEGNDCLNPNTNPSSGTDGFKYIFTVGSGSLAPKDGVFTEDPIAGTATLTGHLESVLHPGYGFDVNITWVGRTTNSAGGMGPLLELDPGCYKTGQNPNAPVDVSTWHFYSAVSNATLTGTGNYAGAVVTLNPVMHYFQVGAGASGKNVQQGMSGWFSWVVNHQPNNPQFCLRNSAAVNRTADFNLNCPPHRECTGKIGDRVWNDLNKNGCQDPGEPGMANVQVDLYEGCNGDRQFKMTKFTDANGNYFFDQLCAGSYSVCFHTPNGFTHTLANQSCPTTGGDASDSDCECTGADSPCCVCVVLPNDNITNLTIDCGYVQNCALTVTKSCVVPTPSPTATAFDCKTMKPINELKMIWNGSQTIDIKAWKGAIGSTLLSTQMNITPGTTVTVSGYAGSPNDVVWELFNAGTGFTSKIGNSDFHVSCSDVDMNGPEDCGKAEGDAKGLSGFINQWIFAGMSGNGISINCGGSNGGNPSSNCVLVPGPGLGCNPETGLGKPTSLTFKYTGGGCGASNNPQSGKFICSGSVNTALPITVSNQDSYQQSTTTVSPGGTITFTKGGSTLSAQSDFTLTNSGGTEKLSIHTSCSQPLHIGDVFGDFTLVGFNGQTGGNAIVYHYEVKNTGASVLTNVFLNDDKLGQIAGPFSLNAGETKTFDTQTTLSQTTTNTATASVQGGSCSAQSNPVTVTLSTPTPTPTPTATPQQGNCTTSGRPNRLVMTYTGGSCASSQNSQGPPNFSVCQKFCCTEFGGGLTGVSPVHVIVSSSSSTPTGSTQRYFEGDVAAGADFTVLSGSSTFGTNTYFYIYENGVLKQKVQIHTSCSAPLIRGETFGGVKLKDYSN